MFKLTSLELLNDDAPQQGFDDKGVLALQLLRNLQQKVITNDSEREYKPSQLDIAKISSIVFKARPHNQQQLNDWFVDSVNKMVSKVSEEYMKTFDKAENLLKDCLQIIRILINYIYYSGVFIIDAKESSKLFTLGLHILKDKFVQPLLSQIVQQIVILSRTLPTNCPTEQIEIVLYEAKHILQVILSFGWKEITLLRKQEGISTQRMDNSQAPNTFFNENFEVQYTKLLSDIMLKLPHSGLLGQLTNQIQHEHKILKYIAPFSEETIMDQVEGESVLKVIHQLETTIPGLIENKQDDQVLEVVRLFVQVNETQSQKNEKLPFQLGQQFNQKRQNLDKFPLKPFINLAQMLRKYFITHAPQEDLNNLLTFIKLQREYIKRIFNNQHDILIAFSQALEIVLNTYSQVDELILEEFQLSKDCTQQDELLTLSKYLYQPTFLSKYQQALAKRSMGFVTSWQNNKHFDFQHELVLLTKIKEHYINSASSQLKVKQMMQFLLNIEKGYQTTEQNVKEQFFNQIQSILISQPELVLSNKRFININLLPKLLQNKIGDSTRLEGLLLSDGYVVIQFKEFKLLLNNYQLIILTFLEEQESSASMQKLTQLLDDDEEMRSSLKSLIHGGLLMQQEQTLSLNQNWSPRAQKQLTVFIPQTK